MGSPGISSVFQQAAGTPSAQGSAAAPAPAAPAAPAQDTAGVSSVFSQASQPDTNAQPDVPVVGDNRSWYDKAKDLVQQYGSDFLTGAGRGATEHVGNAEAAIAQGIHNATSAAGRAVGTKKDAGEAIIPQEGIDALRARAQQEGKTDNTTQAIGKGAESAGEMFLPGVGEEAALGKGAGLVARTAYGAATTGAINKAQGGDFTTGAAFGAGTGLLESAARAVAPKLAEAALGVTGKMRGNGRDIGNAILENTVGVSPGSISKQAEGVIGKLQNQLEGAAFNASAQGAKASTRPALQVLSDAMNTAEARNSATTAQKLSQVIDQLTKEYKSGNAIPSDVSPSRILDLKRGIGELVNSWGPGEAKPLQITLRKVYGALDAELDRTVPESQKLNQQISSLIPAKQAAAKAANNAGTAQRTVNRFRAATGALAGTGIGAGIGYHEGGRTGAAIGAGLGMVAPDLISGPEGTMSAARVAANPNIAARVPVAVGSGLYRGLSQQQ
jgi:hypothetical protein